MAQIAPARYAVQVRYRWSRRNGGRDEGIGSVYYTDRGPQNQYSR